MGTNGRTEGRTDGKLNSRSRIITKTIHSQTLFIFFVANYALFSKIFETEKQTLQIFALLECLCSVPICAPDMLKVLDFSADNDQDSDSNSEFTSASLDAGALPESFTVCSAIMVDAWTTEFSAARMFTLLDYDGDRFNCMLPPATQNTKYGLAECTLSSRLKPCSSHSSGHVPASPWTQLQAR